MSSSMIEHQRLQALVSLNLMDTPPEERFDRITRMAREVFDVPMAALNLVDDEHVFTKSSEQLGNATLERNRTFCDVTIDQELPLVVPDAQEDPRFAGLPDVAGGIGLRFYAGQSLAVGDGYRVGTLCLFDTAPRDFTEQDEQLLNDIATWAERELHQALEADRAYDIQQALLPSRPGVPGFDVAGICVPYRQVGGDFYLWSTAGGRLDLTLADVMGKGTGAALIASTVRAAVRAADRTDPAAVLDRASTLLAADLEATALFATVFQAGIDTMTGVVRYADAGHGLTVIVNEDGSYRRLEGGGLPLGIGEAGSWLVREATIQPGETLLAFTDGLLDLYGGTLEALQEIAALVTREKDAESLVGELRRVARDLQADDDLTAVVVRRDRREP
jgi:sigma-B regulation protein RsbU (phosphoserine phosphatase)